MLDTWSDKIEDISGIHIALVDPMPEDAAVGTLGQLIVTQRPSDNQRSAVLSVYDSDPDAERSPYTFALVLPNQLTLRRLIDLLHLGTDCNPPDLRNHCSLWFGRIPIAEQAVVNIHIGHAFRLLITRGAAIGITQLLTMSNNQLRETLQRSMHAQIFVRPLDPDFLHSADLDGFPALQNTDMSPSTRPEWIRILHRHFDSHHVVEDLQEGAVLTVQVWYLNVHPDFHCNQQRQVRLDDDPLSWRTDLIFPWRDRLLRATPTDTHVLHACLASPDHLPPEVQVLIAQGLTTDSCAVIVTRSGNAALSLRQRRFAHVLLCRVAVREVLRLVVPDEHAHRPSFVQFEGRTYLPGEFLLLRTGAHLGVVIEEHDIDLFTDQIADSFSLFQASGDVRRHVVACKPAPFAEPDDLAMILPSPNLPPPARPIHDGAVEWSYQLGELFLQFGELNLWNDARFMDVTTWYLHHGLRPICRRPRSVRLDGHVVTWIDDLRTAWADFLDPTMPFSIHLVHPRPPQFRVSRSTCHLLLEQGRTQTQAGVILTALLEGSPNDGMIQGAYSTANRVDLQTIISTMEIGQMCVGRSCNLVVNRQILPPVEWIDVHTGQSVRVSVASPGADPIEQDLAHLRFDDLSLMQTSDACFQFNPDAPAFDPNLPSIHLQPEWLQDLQHMWEVSAHINEREDRAAIFLTWFVSPGTGQGRCLLSRKATLSGDFLQWEQAFKQIWIDMIDPAAPVTFVPIIPQPDALEPAVAGHVILIQHDIETMSSPLITVTDAAIHQGTPFRIVTTVNEKTFPRDLLQGVGYDRDCYLQGAQCNLRLGSLPLREGKPVPVRDGDCMYIQVTRAFLPSNWNPPITPPLSGTEGTSLLQTRMQLTARPRSKRRRPARPAVSHLRIVSWFLSSSHPVCRQHRHTVVLEDQNLAKVAEELWDDLTQGCTCNVFAVETMRRCIAIEDELDEIAFLVVYEQPVEYVSILLEEIVDDGIRKATEHVAALAPADTSLEAIWSLLQGKPSTPNLDAVDIYVQGRTCDVLDWPDLANGHCVSFWMNQIQLANLSTLVDFTGVFKTLDWLDTHFFLPQYALPTHFPFLPCSLDWLDPWWDPCEGGTHLRIYMDGSCVSTSRESKAGAAVAAFVKVDGCWKFAGALSTQLPDSFTSYMSELAASIIASKLAFDILKLLHASPVGNAPELTMCYDSLTAGMQTSGQWNVYSAPRYGRLLRSLQKCIEAKFRMTIQYQHIKAHRGEPGNELVDTLAHQAALGAPLHELSDWITTVSRSHFVDMAEWCWFLFRPDLSWQGCFLCLPAAPSTVPDSSIVDADCQETAQIEDTIGELSLCLATCNVLSLLPEQGKMKNVQGPARQDSMLRQFDEAGVHIFAMQETRIKRLSNAHDTRYWLYKAPATAQGHFGVMIGLSRTKSIGTILKGGTCVDVFISQEDVAVIAADPRFLILRIRTVLFRAILIAGHAPHSGATASDISNWWQSLSRALPDRYTTWPRILLVDANARVGAEPCQRIGPHQAEKGSGKEEGFTQFVRSQGLFLPATFAQCHSGTGGTWLHNNGNWCRNDFVGLPIEWHYESCQSWVSPDIDAGLAKSDHLASLAHVVRNVRIRPEGVHHKPFKLQLHNIEEIPILPIQPYDWTLDVHSHAHCLQMDLVDQLWGTQTKRVKQPMKTTMSPDTWQLVCQKREARNELSKYGQLQKETLLAAWFACWKHAALEYSQFEVFTSYDELLQQHDHLIAATYHRFRCLGRQVVKALRKDDAEFYDHLLREGAAFLGPKEVKNLWRIVRRSLPKFQQRRMNVPPLQLEGPEDQWLPHFGELEAGSLTTMPDLLSKCVQRQTRALFDAPRCLQVGELPSVFDLEDAFRRTSTDKATGEDPLPSGLFHFAASALAGSYHDLLVKEFVWQSEPIQYKGGPVAIIPKCLAPTTAKQFRGILLLGNMAKRTHSVLRQQVMSHLVTARAPGQLGGFPGQQVMFGSQALRMFGMLADASGVSSVVLFLDLSNAFHHLVRELVTGISTSRNLAAVLAVLQQTGHPVDKIQAACQLPGLLAELGAPPMLVRLVCDIHAETWCSLPNRQRLHTCRGTHPVARWRISSSTSSWPQ